jgi:hypothetical protein
VREHGGRRTSSTVKVPPPSASTVSNIRRTQWLIANALSAPLIPTHICIRCTCGVSARCRGPSPVYGLDVAQQTVREQPSTRQVVQANHHLP